MLAYGTAADMLDEYLKVAKSTALKCLEKLVQGVIDVFGSEYLRRPIAEDMDVCSKLESLVDSLECWVALTACIGDGKIVQQHGRGNIPSVAMDSQRSSLKR
jgi:hypothetical protein